MTPRAWIVIGGLAALGLGVYAWRQHAKRKAEGLREAQASRAMIQRIAAQGAARRVSDAIKAGPKPGVIPGPGGFAAQLTARLNP